METIPTTASNGNPTSENVHEQLLSLLGELTDKLTPAPAPKPEKVKVGQIECLAPFSELREAIGRHMEAVIADAKDFTGTNGVDGQQRKTHICCIVAQKPCKPLIASCKPDIERKNNVSCSKKHGEQRSANYKRITHKFFIHIVPIITDFLPLLCAVVFCQSVSRRLK